MARPSQCLACGCFENCIFPNDESCADKIERDKMKLKLGETKPAFENQPNYETRNLTVDETSELVRQLTIRLGHSNAMSALGVIAGLQCAIFKAK